MMPASPPPPTAWKRPFQVLPSGSQTSKLIAGATVPVTRHSAGTLSGCCTPGALKSPAGTRSASVIFVSGSVSFCKSAQAVAAYAGAPMQSETADATVERASNGRFMFLNPPGQWTPAPGPADSWRAKSIGGFTQPCHEFCQDRSRRRSPLRRLRYHAANRS